MFKGSATGGGCCAGEPPPAAPVQATLQRELKPCLGAEAVLPIRAVWHVPGSKASEQSSILVLGGQGAEEPDMLHMLPLAPRVESEACLRLCATPAHPMFGGYELPLFGPSAQGEADPTQEVS